MSEETYNKIKAQLNAVQKEIEALPESSANGLLIDAGQCLKSSENKLMRYFMLVQGK